MQTIIILILVGIASGILGGLVGVGGGIIIVPSLVYFLGFSQKTAQGTSLGILLLPIGILGVWQFYKAGYVDMRTVWLVSLGFLAGSYFGSKIALSLPQDTVKKIFAILLLLVAFKMLFFDKKIKESASENVKPVDITLSQNDYLPPPNDS
ncbi:MAG: sulfite exporter TauE/SafE family protein [Chitinophagaceae bacterium]|nr:sulfite exporter TauE/SafE family protein [Chitinophagaceae bacterium]